MRFSMMKYAVLAGILACIALPAFADVPIDAPAFDTPTLHNTGAYPDIGIPLADNSADLMESVPIAFDNEPAAWTTTVSSPEVGSASAFGSPNRMPVGFDYERSRTG